MSSALKSLDEPPRSESVPTFDEIYQAYLGYVARLGYEFLSRPDLVDDFVQDVFLDVYRGLSRLKDAGALKAWIRQIAVRRALRQLKRRRLVRMLGLDKARADTLSQSADQEWVTLLGEVNDALKGCSAEERVVFVLRKVQGEKLEDIAELLGCGLTTVKRRLFAAQRRIQGRVEQ
ncbi:MAG: sigma-70 family RNA polymerase sigma factor [Myxococcota bacterium]